MASEDAGKLGGGEFRTPGSRAEFDPPGPTATTAGIKKSDVGTTGQVATTPENELLQDLSKSQDLNAEDYYSDDHQIDVAYPWNTTPPATKKPRKKGREVPKGRLRSTTKVEPTTRAPTTLSHNTRSKTAAENNEEKHNSSSSYSRASPLLCLVLSASLALTLS